MNEIITKTYDDRTLPLEFGQFYHIYNRGNNRDNIFYRHENYLHFLTKIAHYLPDFIDIYSYCLLPNHFHLLVRVKDDLEIIEPSKPKFQGENKIKIITEQFRLLFMSYAKGINNQEGRVGSLFQKGFRRKHVDNQDYLLNLVEYIHSNAKRHGIHYSTFGYPYSSYRSILSNKNTLLKRKEVLNWFGNKQSFINAHTSVQDIPFQEYWIEDDRDEWL